LSERRAAFVFLIRNDEVLFVRHAESSNIPQTPTAFQAEGLSQARSQGVRL